MVTLLEFVNTLCQELEREINKYSKWLTEDCPPWKDTPNCARLEAVTDTLRTLHRILCQH